MKPIEIIFSVVFLGLMALAIFGSFFDLLNVRESIAILGIEAVIALLPQLKMSN